MKKQKNIAMTGSYERKQPAGNLTNVSVCFHRQGPSMLMKSHTPIRHGNTRQHVSMIFEGCFHDTKKD